MENGTLDEVARIALHPCKGPKANEETHAYLVDEIHHSGKRVVDVDLVSSIQKAEEKYESRGLRMDVAGPGLCAGCLVEFCGISPRDVMKNHFPNYNHGQPRVQPKP